MQIITKYWMFILPLVVLQLLLMGIAIADIIKSSEFKIGNKVVWIFVSVLISLIGPIIYFVFGKEDN